MVDPIIARNVRRSFGAGKIGGEVLHGVDLSVAAGEFVALVGPSGCGKSTLLNILGLADQASSGEVVVGGVSVQGASEGTLRNIRRSKLGYVFQNFNLLSTLTAIENVMVPLILNGASVEEARGRARNLIRHIGLEGRLEAFPHTLSGGEMQRIAIARALVHEPLIILADEPTGNLDSNSGAVVLELLREASHSGVAILMATHSESALGWCSRVLRMKDGALES